MKKLLAIAICYLSVGYSFGQIVTFDSINNVFVPLSSFEYNKVVIKSNDVDTTIFDTSDVKAIEAWSEGYSAAVRVLAKSLLSENPSIDLIDELKIKELLLFINNRKYKR